MIPASAAPRSSAYLKRRIGTVLAAVGAPLTLAGALMYVLPGPGVPVLVIGLALLVTGLIMAATGHR